MSLPGAGLHALLAESDFVAVRDVDAGDRGMFDRGLSDSFRRLPLSTLRAASSSSRTR